MILHVKKCSKNINISCKYLNIVCKNRSNTQTRLWFRLPDMWQYSWNSWNVRSVSPKLHLHLPDSLLHYLLIFQSNCFLSVRNATRWWPLLDITVYQIHLIQCVCVLCVLISIFWACFVWSKLVNKRL